MDRTVSGSASLIVREAEPLPRISMSMRVVPSISRRDGLKDASTS